MITSKQWQDGRTIIEMDLSDLETYPAWQTTSLVHIRINDKPKKRWTDCWISAINKNRRVKFFMEHQKGYPSEEKGTSQREIVAHWLSDEVPVIKDTEQKA